MSIIWSRLFGRSRSVFYLILVCLVVAMISALKRLFFPFSSDTKRRHRAVTLLRQRKFDEVIPLMSEIITGGKPTSDDFAFRALSRYSLSDFRQSLKDYTKAINIDPNRWGYYSCRAWCHYFCEHYDEAIRDATRAIEMNPRHGTAYNCRGSCFRELKQFDNALEDHNMAVSLKPTNDRFLFNRGVTLYFMKKYRLAMRDFTKTYECNPQCEVAARSFRGTVCLALRRFEDAIRDLSVGIFPEENREVLSMRLVRRCFCYCKLKDFDRANADLQQASDLRNGSFDWIQEFLVVVQFGKEFARFVKARNLTGRPAKELQKAILDAKRKKKTRW